MWVEIHALIDREAFEHLAGTLEPVSNWHAKKQFLVFGGKAAADEHC